MKHKLFKMSIMLLVCLGAWVSVTDVMAAIVRSRTVSRTSGSVRYSSSRAVAVQRPRTVAVVRRPSTVAVVRRPSVAVVRTRPIIGARIYTMPVGYTTVYTNGVTYYVSGGVRYTRVYEGSRVVYVVVQ